MNQNLKQLIENQFSDHEDRNFILKLITVAIESPSDVAKISQEMVNSIEPKMVDGGENDK